MNNEKDASPVIPMLGPIKQSSLAQRRASRGSKDNLLLDDSYYRYEEYDNVSLSPPHIAQATVVSW